MFQDGPLAWANLNVFDYAGTLESGVRTLYAWPVEYDHQLQNQVTASCAFSPLYYEYTVEAFSNMSHTLSLVYA